MQGRIYEEVPQSKQALVPVRIDAVRINKLVRDKLVNVPRLELHLFLEVLVIDDANTTQLTTITGVVLAHIVAVSRV